MDVKIESGDMLLSSCGNPVYISFMDEISQRVKIACSVMKGDFPFDRELGRYPIAVDVEDSTAKDKLEMIFKEATIDIPYSDLRVMRIQETENGVAATIRIYCGENSATTEVTINDRL